MGLGSAFRVWGFGLRVWGFGFRVSGFGFRVPGFGFRVSDFGFRVSGVGFRFEPSRMIGPPRKRREGEEGLQASSQSKNNSLAELRIGSDEGAYLRLIDLSLNSRLESNKKEDKLRGQG